MGLHKIIRLRLSYNARKDGQRSIVIAYGLLRYPTGLYVREDCWNAGEEIVLRQDSLYKAKNTRLADIIARLEAAVVGKAQPSDKEFKQICQSVVDGKESEVKTILDYWLEFEKLKTEPGTLRVYTNARKKVAEFDAAVTFETLNRGWLIKFNACLQQQGYNANYISIIMRSLRAVNNYCIDCEYTEVYPWRRFQIKSEPTRKRCLTLEQLRTLRDYPVEAHQIKYRDSFMLSFYLIGINYADLFDLTPADCHDGVIEYRRHKTGTLYSIKVEPEAQEIIDRNRGKEHLLSWADEWGAQNFLWRCNKELKKIGSWRRAPGRGGRKVFDPLFPELSTYWARHSWATIASGLDVPIEVIGHALGHSDKSHSVTSIYIKYDSGKVDAANRKVLDALKGNNPQ